MDQIVNIKDQIEKVKKIAALIQASELLKIFQEEEDDASYKDLTSEFEAQLMEIHAEVANSHPLLLVQFEREFLNLDLEGLFLPKLLGFAVLRGHYDFNYKYSTPQDQFKELLLAICSSTNFDNIKNRVGQSIQIGFALSSDIWITNLIETVENKKIKLWLQAQKLEKYYKVEERKNAYIRYKKQFNSFNYYVAIIPTTVGELKHYYPSLKYFLFQRQRLRLDNSNIKPAIIEMLLNKNLEKTPEYDHILFILISFFNLHNEERTAAFEIFNAVRKENKNVIKDYFEFLLEMYDNQTILGPDNDRKVKTFIDEKIEDDILKYYDLIDELHSKGFIHVDVIDSIKNYINQFQGLSNQNEAVRQAVLRYIKEWIDHASPDVYTDYFELFKSYKIYMDIFDNQNFNHELKYSSKNYLQKLFDHFQDKRGKDYQDIKRFVSYHFVEVGFMSEKEASILFKTKRKVKE